MMNFVTPNDEGVEEGELVDDENTTLADDLLDEVAGDEAEEEVIEGFGILPEVGEEEEEKDGETEDGDEELEEDAEDVAFDSFDDVDEL